MSMRVCLLVLFVLKTCVYAVPPSRWDNAIALARFADTTELSIARIAKGITKRAFTERDCTYPITDVYDVLVALALVDALRADDFTRVAFEPVSDFGRVPSRILTCTVIFAMKEVSAYLIAIQSVGYRETDPLRERNAAFARAFARRFDFDFGSCTRTGIYGTAVCWHNFNPYGDLRLAPCIYDHGRMFIFDDDCDTFANGRVPRPCRTTDEWKRHCNNRR
ncbi:MAG: hypothetical protein LBT18_01555 [Endomicrobium sp.]|nr:hypothetical protein [Endomicrobium sp.]